MNEKNKKLLDEALEDEKSVNKKRESIKAKIKEFLEFNPRALRHGSAAVVLTCLFVAAMIVINMIAGRLVEKFPSLSTDLTSDKFFEVSDEIIDYVKSVDSDIEIIVMSKEDDFASYDSDGYFKQANMVFHQIANSNDRITLRYVDMAANPTFINNYGDDKERIQSSCVIVQNGSEYRIITADDLFNAYFDTSTYMTVISSSKAEQAIASAIMNVTIKDKPKVAFLTGYNEDKDDCKSFETFLTDNGFDVSEVEILTEEISDDTKLAVIYAPYYDYDENTIAKVSKWLEAGDKSLIYTPYYASADTPIINSLLEQYGMKVGTGIVYENDTTRLVSTDSYFITTTTYYNTDYTDNLKSTAQPVISALAKPIQITDENKASALLKCSEQSGIYPLEAADDNNWTPEASIVGDVTVCAVGEKAGKDEKTSKVLLVGSSIAISENSFKMSAYNNSDYYLNAVNIITDRDSTGITIAPKSVDMQQLGITASQVTRLGVIFIGVIPVALLVVGFVIWFRRRNK